MAASANGKLDQTMMMAFHAGFRRDANRLVSAAENKQTDQASVKAGWAAFKNQLQRHHHAEDEDLWPVARSHLSGNAVGLALLDEMQAEHSKIDPTIDAIDAAIADPDADSSEIISLATYLRDNLNAHLDHEERDVLPLLDTCVSQTEWKEFSEKQRRKGGIKNAAVLFPWLVDGNTPEGKKAVGLLPAPLRLVNQYVWTRSYNKTPKW